MVLLKATIVVFGVIVIGLSSHSYFDSEWNKNLVEDGDPPLALELTLMVSAVITFAISGVVLIGSLLRLSFLNSDFIKLNIGFYEILAGLLMLSGGIMVIHSLDRVHRSYGDPDDRNNVQKYDEKIAASVFAIINSVLYIASGLSTLMEVPVE